MLRLGSRARAGTTSKGKEYTGTGGMVAWVPPRALAERLVLPGKDGEAVEDLHLTLCFFPDFTVLDVRAVAEAMERVSVAFGPLQGEVSGVGRFSIPDGDAVVALVDVPDLGMLREALVWELRQRDVEPANDHGFTAHITLAYLDPGRRRMPVERIEPHPITIASLVLTGPDGSVGEIALGGAKAEKIAGIPGESYEGTPPAGPFADEWLETEAAHAKVLARAMAALGRAVFKELRSDLALRRIIQQKDVDVLNDPAFWDAARQANFAPVYTSASEILASGTVQAARLGLPIKFDLVHQQALALARTYTDAWWEQFAGTTQDKLRRELQTFIRTGGGPMRDLERRLAPLFGEKRARLIAMTETTRLFALGNEAAYAASGVVHESEWRTANDERVCEACAGLLGERWPLGTGEVPPKHPGCRCVRAPVVNARALLREAQMVAAGA